MRSKIKPIRAIKFHESRPIFRNNSYTDTNIISNFPHVKMSVFLFRPSVVVGPAPRRHRPPPPEIRATYAASALADWPHVSFLSSVNWSGVFGRTCSSDH